MKIAAENPARCAKDEKLINKLREKVSDYGFDLNKVEGELSRVQKQLAKNADERACLVKQLKERLNMANQEPETSIVNPSKEAEEFDVNAMREEMYKLKQQMTEMYQAWAKGHPPPVYPANPAYIP
ncbi:uncharacterized protein [Nicotiana sylvestris]|uniref:uncharacterized protein n=1 Tax=Nicotiana sylvestris TaxID=4096 RepID=UPI00388C8D15